MKSWKLGLAVGVIAGALFSGVAMGGQELTEPRGCEGCLENWKRCTSLCAGSSSCQQQCAEDYDICMSACEYEYP